MKRKIIANLVTLPRWFAIPFFGASALLGAVLAGGITLNAWIALIGCLLVMAGGHSFNSFLDYAWTGLDKGEVENRSAEKTYTGGQNLIETKVVSLREVYFNAISWYILSAIPIVYLVVNVTPLIFIPWVAGMLMTFFYSWSKFNYTHEIALGLAVGPVPMIIGMLAVNPAANWVHVLLVSVPFAIVLSFAGLALDEWPDAEANLKKGVKSLAYEVWKWSDVVFNTVEIEKIKGELENGKGVIIPDKPLVKSLSTIQWYLTGWFLFMFFYQGLLIQFNILKPLTGLTFLTFPFLMACMLKLKSNFKKWVAITVIVGALYVILLLVGQIVGG
jgi:1,4-dihydroxy-2-naphthoate octaprenyltransferase